MCVSVVNVVQCGYICTVRFQRATGCGGSQASWTIRWDSVSVDTTDHPAEAPLCWGHHSGPEDPFL